MHASGNHVEAKMKSASKWVKGKKSKTLQTCPPASPKKPAEMNILIPNFQIVPQHGFPEWKAAMLVGYTWILYRFHFELLAWDHTSNFIVNLWHFIPWRNNQIEPRVSRFQYQLWLMAWPRVLMSCYDGFTPEWTDVPTCQQQIMT